jgi:hypothetical protein
MQDTLDANKTVHPLIPLIFLGFSGGIAVAEI